MQNSIKLFNHIESEKQRIHVTIGEQSKNKTKHKKITQGSDKYKLKNPPVSCSKSLTFQEYK